MIKIMQFVSGLAFSAGAAVAANQAKNYGQTPKGGLMLIIGLISFLAGAIILGRLMMGADSTRN